MEGGAGGAVAVAVVLTCGRCCTMCVSLHTHGRMQANYGASCLTADPGPVQGPKNLPNDLSAKPRGATLREALHRKTRAPSVHPPLQHNDHTCWWTACTSRELGQERRPARSGLWYLTALTTSVTPQITPPMQERSVSQVKWA